MYLYNPEENQLDDRKKMGVLYSKVKNKAMNLLGEREQSQDKLRPGIQHSGTYVFNHYKEAENEKYKHGRQTMGTWKVRRQEALRHLVEMLLKNQGSEMPTGFHNLSSKRVLGDKFRFEQLEEQTAGQKMEIWNVSSP